MAEAAAQFDVPELAAAKALEAGLRERSDEIESAGEVPGDLVQRMRAQGLFEATVPRVYGGSERHAVDVLRLIESVSYGDSAAGWLTMIYGTTALIAASLPDEWAQTVFGPSPTPIVAGATAPTAKARRVDGGIEVTGRWAWGSGTAHCDWICGGTMVTTGDGIEKTAAGHPAVHIALFEADQVHLHGNWDASGLRGTGSGDFEVENAFVPEGRWILLGASPSRLDGALYRMPFFGLFAAAVAAVPLGIARRALDDFTELARSKVPAWGRTTINESSLVQLDLGRAEALVEGARRYLFDVVGEVHERVARGDDASLEDRRQLRLAATQAATWCCEAVDIVYNAGGGTSVLGACSLQRHFRDVHTATGHRLITRAPVRLAGALRLTDVAFSPADL